MSKKVLKYTWLFILPFFFLFPAIVHAEIFFQDDFESANFNKWYIMNVIGDPCYSGDQISATTEDKFTGAYSAKFTLPIGDMCTYMTAPFSRRGQGEDIYFKFNLKYAANREWPYGNADKTAEIRGDDSGNRGARAIFVLDRGAVDSSHIVPYPTDPHMAKPTIWLPAAGDNSWHPCNDPIGDWFCQNIDVANPVYFEVGKWYTIEMYIRVDAYGAGQLKLWINGKLVIDINNIYTIRDAAQAYYTVYAGGTLNQPDYTFPIATASYWDDIVISNTCSSCNQSYLQFSPATYDVSEAGTTATVTVTRTGSSAGAVSVDYATSNGTATAGSDYTATNGTLSWTDGDAASKTFTVSITNDTADENDETVNLTLSNPTGGAILGSLSAATLDILDDEGTSTLQFRYSTYSVTENGATATIRATRTNSSAGAVSVSYATSNGTAASGSDYTAASGTLSWTSGDITVKTFTVSIANDTAVEGNETINLTLTNPTGSAVLGSRSTATLTITDDDSNPDPNPNPNPDSNITTNSSAGDAEVSGGGCGFVKDDNGKGPRAKGEAAAFAMMLIMTLAGIAVARRFSNRFSYNL